MNGPHILSAGVGFIAAGILAFTTSQTATPLAALTPAGIARVEYYARPQDMIRIREGTPFQVPPGKVLVITALGGTGLGGQVRLRADGETVFRGDVATGVHELTGMSPLPSGASVSVSTENYPQDFPSGNPVPAHACAWGYLDKSVPPTGAVLRVRYEPHPSQIVELRQGSPLTVPPGRVLVLITMGRTDSLDHMAPDAVPHLLINGLHEYFDNEVGQEMVWDVPVGLTAQSGDVVEPIAMSLDLREGYVPLQTGGRAWGYLADQ